MPQLPQYESRRDRFQISDRAMEANAYAGRNIGRLYSQSANEVSGAARDQARAAADFASGVGEIGEGLRVSFKAAEDYLDRRTISKGQAEGEKVFADLKNAWNDTVKNAATKDPNDPTVAAKFREETLEPALEKFKEAYSGTPGAAAWADNYTARVRHHMWESTTADMSTLAGMAAARNVSELKTRASNTAHTGGDFHTANFLLGNVDGQVDAIIAASPNLKGTAAMKLRSDLTQDLRQSIVKAGAIGAIAKSPDPEKTAEEWSKRFPDLIDGADAQTLAKNARQQIRAARQDQRWEDQQRKEERREVSEGRRDEILQDLYSDDPKRIAKVNARSIVNDPRLEPAMKEHLIRLQERELKPESAARVSAEASRELFSRIYLPAGDPNKITNLDPIIQARIDGKLTKADFNDLRTEVVNARSPEGDRLGKGIDELVKAVKPAVDKSNPLMGKMDPDGGINLYRFESDLRKKAAEYRRAGKDPHDLLDPSKPDFMGSPKALAPYQKSLSDSMKDVSSRLRGVRGNLTDPGTTITGIKVEDKPVPPRNSGESVDAWLARTGRK